MSTPQSALARGLRATAAVLAVALLAACAGPSGSGDLAAGTCTSSAPNASYTGPYRGTENRLDAQDMARDLGCAMRFKAGKFPAGFVVIYGSSRLSEDKPGAPPSDNGQLYEDVLQFARDWTRLHAQRIPIMTGAGPGLMEAANRGATEAGGPSIGYTTYYGPARDQGDARLAFQTYQGQPIVSDGLVFSSVAMREAMMVLHTAAAVIAPGGTGTEWETFQIIESIKSRQLDPVPVVLFGNREKYWKSFEQRVQAMARLGTIRASEVADHVLFVEEPEQLLDLLGQRLRLR